MDDDFRHIIVADSLDGIGKGELAGYLIASSLRSGFVQPIIKATKVTIFVNIMIYLLFLIKCY